MTAQRARTTPDDRRWRAAILMMSAVGVLYWVLATFECSPLLPWCGTAGFGVDYLRSSAAVVVSRLDPTGPASRAGLRIGDRIELHSIPFSTRYWLREVRSDTPVPANHVFYLPTKRGEKQVVIVVRARPVPEKLTWQSAIADAANLWGLLFAIFLSIRVPGSKQARLLSLVLVTYFVGRQTSGLVPWPTLDFVLYLFNLAVLHALPISLFSLYAATFATPLSVARVWLLRAGVILPLIGAATSVTAGITWYVLALPSDWLRTMVVSYTVALGCIASVACGIMAAVASSGPARRRAAWSAVSVAPVWLMWAYSYSIALYVTQQVVNSVGTLAYVAAILMPLGLTYAVVTRRFVDIGFVVNRTIVFGAVSVFVLGIFVLAEWAIGQWIAATDRTAGIFINVVVALCVGLSVQFTHTRIAHIVSRAFFRKRHEDRAALHRFSSEAPFITEPAVILERTISMLRYHTDAGSVSVLLRKNDATYACVAGDGAGRMLSENDPAIVALRAWHMPIDLHGYETSIDGDRAFPMSVRAELMGIIVCGAKPSGEAWAPDESETLELLAGSVGSALQMLAAREPQDRSGKQIDALIESVGQLAEQNRLLLHEMLLHRELLSGDATETGGSSLIR
jgi:hypothetical protein